MVDALCQTRNTVNSATRLALAIDWLVHMEP
jgi:hypothetical protein